MSGAVFIIIFIPGKDTTVIIYKQANKTNTDTNTKSAVIVIMLSLLFFHVDL